MSFVLYSWHMGQGQRAGGSVWAADWADGVADGGGGVITCLYTE
jgi:hypothetical protein